jgi:hypothetical protein
VSRHSGADRGSTAGHVLKWRVPPNHSYLTTCCLD